MYSKLSTMYYETSKPIGTSLGGDLEFYFEAIKQSRSILEVGSGTGRLLIPFLKEGLKIEGIDASSDMVSMCITHCIEHDVEANVKQIDVYNMSEVGTFDAIIIPTGTFCLFSDPNAVIEGCYEHLEKGGKVVS
ncbi:class I SAM-dependent methyltransferase [Erysipelothrix rhusiopathiae]|nr:class I SAM-dependent methyltransferase [Erysipelothrix rhusiopathiae]MDE8166517.1 class I SAM-dependent methyltransferase [Erysipelothrix rhusiopathiae]